MRAILFVLAATLPLLAQTPQPLPPLVETAEVRRVNVDVTVTDGEGRPISGLTREDFEVYSDGQLQAIDGFYAVEDASVRLARNEDPMPPEPQMRRRFVLMIDNNTVQKLHRDAALEFVAGFLDNVQADNYEWAVLSVGKDVETLQSFTTDKEAVRSALLKARRKPTYQFQSNIDRDILSDQGRAALRDTPGSGYDFRETARFQSQEQTKRTLLAGMNSAKAVIQTCRAYSASAGRKALVMITGGMELNTTFGIADDRQDRNILDMKRNMEQMLNTMVREANAADFKIYVVKPGGHQNRSPQHDVSNRTAGLGGTVRNPFFGQGFTTGGDTSDVDSSSLTLALQTGGRFIPSADTKRALEVIDDDAANFYSLAFRPPHPEDAKYHGLRVRVKRPDVRISHRNGYVSLSADQRLELSLRAPISYAKEKGILPVTLEVGSTEKPDAEKRVVPIIATLPVQSLTLLSRGERRVGRVHVYLSIYDETGNNVGYHHRVQNVDIASGQDQPFRHEMKVGLKKGRFTVVVTLRDELSDEIGTGFKDLRLM